MGVVEEPIGAELHRILRAGVLDLREHERRRLFPAVVHAGVPGRVHPRLEVPRAPLDHGLRTELAATLLDRAARRVTSPSAWLTRPGHLHPHDVDQAWLPALIAAGAELGLDPAVVVITPQGWYDPRSGISRRWRRLRAYQPRRDARPRT